MMTRGVDTDTVDMTVLSDGVGKEIEMRMRRIIMRQRAQKEQLDEWAYMNELDD
jgi:hypothetical protein